MWYYLIPIFQEYLVILNIYNGDLITFIHMDIEYSIIDILTLIYLCYNYYNNNNINNNNNNINNKNILIDICFVFLAFIAHIQWYLHNPFHKWPDWWPPEKSEDDIRHRTEYYDTHVMCFAIYLLLFFNNYNMLYRNNLIIN